jgi:hypothetical protein
VTDGSVYVGNSHDYAKRQQRPQPGQDLGSTEGRSSKSNSLSVFDLDQCSFLFNR